MTSEEIRAAFLRFFEEKGHKTIPSSSLIPHGDPTLLLTSAGMVQIKPYFLGEVVPPSPRLVSCQKCFRTTDIESVGDTTHCTFFEMLGNFSVGDYFKQEAISWAWEFVTSRLRLPPERLWITIFLDDDESFRIWQATGVPESRILRCGEEDNFWGPAGSSGPCGPCSEIHYDFGEEFGCGKAACGPNCDCGRFSEIWNLVFTQYNQDEAGQRTPLPKPNIDTGMGLERTAAVVQGKTSVYEIDLFTPLIVRISELAGKKYGSDSSTDNAMRIIAEHSRGLAFLIADGVIPGNEGRGYVLRRLLRRAALFGRRLGLGEPFLAEIAKITIEQMGNIYPELVQRQDFINRVIELEEARFSDTLSTGLELLDEIMGKTAIKKSGKIPGKQAFELYDTYGFPIELTREIAAERGLSIDLEGFEKEMEKQRERARAAHKFELPTLRLQAILTEEAKKMQESMQAALQFALPTLRLQAILAEEAKKMQESMRAVLQSALPTLRLQAILAEEAKKMQESMQAALQSAFPTLRLQAILAEEAKKIQESMQAALQSAFPTIKAMTEVYRQLGIETTPFVGYQSLRVKPRVIRFLVDNESVDTLTEGQEASVILESTPFYGEMGGQVGDTGEIYSPSGRFTVNNTVRMPPDIIVHQGHVTGGKLTVGDEVEAVVDRERRLDIARNHTATHLLQFALRQVLGEHVQQRGSLVAPERFRFDFSHLTAMTPEEAQQVQHTVNDKIRQNLKVYDEEIPYKQAIEEGAIALFDEKYGDTVRVLKIGEPVISTELCGGTHVTATGEIGYFHITSESSIGTGLRRIEAVTGREAEAFIDKRLSDLQETAEYLDAELDDVLDKAYSLVTELDGERKRALALERELGKQRVESLLSRAEVVKGVKVLAATVPSSRPEILREMADLLRERLKSAVVVLGTIHENKVAFIAAVTPDLVAKGYDAGKIVAQVARVTGGGGGGKPGLAQAGGRDKAKLDEALRLVKSLV